MSGPASTAGGSKIKSSQHSRSGNSLAPAGFQHSSMTKTASSGKTSDGQ
jgi:hypothetical protein